MTRYVIIGSGVAGIAAAEAIRQSDARGQIDLIFDDRAGYYSRPGLAYYLTGEIDEKMLYPYQAADFARLALQRRHARVVGIYPQANQVSLHDGARLTYDRLLLATGAAAAQLTLPGAQLKGVVKLDNLADARQIEKLARKARTAVVVGGGITALEIVEALAAKRVRTYYLLRGERYWKNVLDEVESQIIEQRLQQSGVRIIHHCEVAQILEKRDKVAGVQLVDGRKIKCDLVAAAIGIQPRKGLAEAAGLKTERGILVDSSMRASAPQIYAAGDVAQVYDPNVGEWILDSLWGLAREQGTVAGLNMAGGAAVYQRQIPFNVTRLAHLTTTIIGSVGRGHDRDLLGIARGDSENWRKAQDELSVQACEDVNRLRVLVGERALLGAVLMGDQSLSRPLQDLIGCRVDITPIRQQLLAVDAPVADLILGFLEQYKERNRHAA